MSKQFSFSPGMNFNHDGTIMSDDDINPREIDYEKLVKVKKTGEGTYGIVYTAGINMEPNPKSTKINLDDPNVVKIAVKRNMIDRSTDFTGSIKELDMLQRLKSHPFIVELLDVTFGDPFAKNGRCLSPLRGKGEFKDDKIHFIFEHADCDCEKLIYRKPTSLTHMKLGMIQVLLAMEFMHAKGIIHRDLKPSNILVFFDEDQTPTFKICDFGLAKPYTHQGIQSPRVVTSWYRAPEICLGWPDYTMKSDMWSIGCIFYEMIAKQAFLQDIDDRDNILLVAIAHRLPSPISLGEWNGMLKNKSVPFPSMRKKRLSWKTMIALKPEHERLFNKDQLGTYDQFLDLISHLIVFNPENRYTATQALGSPFFDDWKEYISHITKENPPVKLQTPPIVVYSSPERDKGMKLAFKIFNQRNNLKWYQHRILFQALSIYDRYLNFCQNQEPQNQKPPKIDPELQFIVCVYVGIKYFSTLTIPVSFERLLKDFDQKVKIKVKSTSHNRIDAFETILIRDALQYNIYQDTIYEIADFYQEKLSTSNVRDLLQIYGSLTSFSGLTPENLYRIYRVAQIQTDV